MPPARRSGIANEKVDPFPNSLSTQIRPREAEDAGNILAKTVAQAYMTRDVLVAVQQKPELAPSLPSEALTLVRAEAWRELEVAYFRAAAFWDRIGQLLEFTFFNVRDYRDGFTATMRRLKTNFDFANLPFLQLSACEHWLALSEFERRRHSDLVSKRNVLAHRRSISEEAYYAQGELIPREETLAYYDHLLQALEKFASLDEELSGPNPSRLTVDGLVGVLRAQGGCGEWKVTAIAHQAGSNEGRLEPKVPLPPCVEGDAYVLLRFELSRLLRSGEVSYTVYGERSSDALGELPLDARLEGTFSFRLRGAVSSPEVWSGYSCEVQVNELGSQFRFDHQVRGRLGDGWCAPDGVLVRLYLKPSIVRDLIAVLQDTSPLVREAPASIRVDLDNLHVVGRGPFAGSVGYDVVRLYCG